MLVITYSHSIQNLDLLAGFGRINGLIYNIVKLILNEFHRPLQMVQQAHLAVVGVGHAGVWTRRHRRVEIPALRRTAADAIKGGIPGKSSSLHRRCPLCSSETTPGQKW